MQHRSVQVPLRVQFEMITNDCWVILDDSRALNRVAGSRLHLYQPGDSCLSGPQIDELSMIDLEKVIRQVVVFYRASPKHKLKIVKVSRVQI